MIVYQNECVGCPPSMGCLGEACSRKQVEYFYCDCCGDETDKLFITERGEICLKCLLEDYECIE